MRRIAALIIFVGLCLAVGALGGVLVTWGSPIGTRRNYLLAVGAGMFAAFLGALGLALLEYLVGPW